MHALSIFSCGDIGATLRDNQSHIVKASTVESEHQINRLNDSSIGWEISIINVNATIRNQHSSGLSLQAPNVCRGCDNNSSRVSSSQVLPLPKDINSNLFREKIHGDMCFSAEPSLSSSLLSQYNSDDGSREKEDDVNHSISPVLKETRDRSVDHEAERLGIDVQFIA
jgi:hypothetical protein